MTRQLAHLNALRAFAAAARLGSFTRAAEELGVSPAAVGQQVRGLERYLGQQLFERTPEGLRATSDAVPALADLQAGFERLEAGFLRLKAPPSGDQLSVTVAPALAWKWLAPRLQGLYQRCPQIDLRMDTSLKLADMAGGAVDLAIRYDQVPPDQVLLKELILPVCVAGLEGIGQSLETMTLLHTEQETSDPGVPSWPDWGGRHGLTGAWLERGPRYPNSGMALQAVYDSQGLALCGINLVIDDLVAGRLVAPLGRDAVAAQFAYHIVTSPTRPLSAIHRTFLDWIGEEAGKTRDQITDFLAQDDGALRPISRPSNRSSSGGTGP